MHVVVVQVGHRGHEPALDGLLEVNFAGIRVHHRCEFVARLQVIVLIVGLVEPVVAGHVLEPGMVTAAVVENHVHHHLESSTVGLITQAAVFLVGAKARVHLVVVGRGITVIGRVAMTVGRIVLQHGSEPQGGHAQLGEVVQMLADALDVAAVAQAGLRPVVLVGFHASNLVVGRIAVGKAVGHEHIEHIGDAEAHALVTAHLAGEQLVFHFFLAAALLEGHFHRAGLGITGIQVDEQVVGRIQAYQAVDGHACIVDGHFGITDALAIDHELHTGVFQAHIPVGWLNAVHLNCGMAG